MNRLCYALAVLPVALGAVLVQADEGPIDKGVHMATTGHSLHLFVPGMVVHTCNLAGIKDHVHVRGAPVDAFSAGKRVDVLTTSPFSNPLAPDKRFNELVERALKHNPRMRILAQVSWLNFDAPRRPKAPVDRGAATGESLRAAHAPYLKNVRDQVEALNKQYGKRAIYLVPVAQATIALREKIIAGAAPGLKSQADLFRDDLGHATPPLMVLTGYCNWAVIYRRSPVGLPLHPGLRSAKGAPAWDERLDRLLQQLAWDAVLQEPLSGVTRQ